MRNKKIVKKGQISIQSKYKNKTDLTCEVKCFQA